MSYHLTGEYQNRHPAIHTDVLVSNLDGANVAFVKEFASDSKGDEHSKDPCADCPAQEK